MQKLNHLQCGDCNKILRSLDPGWAHLVVADPPYNIGFEYDLYDDRRAANEYLDWTREWIASCVYAMQPNGSMWIAIGDEYVAEVKQIAEAAGLRLRNWVIWYYTFGVHCVTKFSRSHTHLLYFVRDPEDFCFNADAVRVPSARQLVYNDKRANTTGRVPDNTWVLRPQDVADGGFLPHHSIWYFPRVAGTFKERARFHGCQLPEQLLGRIIRCCTAQNENVLDPFAGTGSTLVVAKKLGRNFFGCELSPEYRAHAEDRINAIRVGDRLVGAEEPTTSAPPTALRRPKLNRPDGLDDEPLIEAFLKLPSSVTTDEVVANPELTAKFIDECCRQKLTGRPADWLRTLLNLRRSGEHAELKGRRAEKPINWKSVDGYEFACEMSLRRLLDEGYRSLDDVLCDPEAAPRFDRYCMSICPGFTPFQYRWVALKLRKAVRKWGETRPKPLELGEFEELEQVNAAREPAVYVVYASNQQPAFSGFTHELKARLSATGSAFERIRDWIPDAGPWLVRKALVAPQEGRRQQREFVRQLHPRLNYEATKVLP